MIVRPASPADVPDLLAIQNAIIRMGGTTAHEVEMTTDRFITLYTNDATAISCQLAKDEEGIIGFQALGFYPGLPAGWADIGTFIDPKRQRSGAGHALFAATLIAAQHRGISVINATIRADNRPGLGYYSRVGFVDYGSDPDYRLKDGARVGRVHKRFDME
jgi:RimJ/RimL family protein N-acetyltransferase